MSKPIRMAGRSTRKQEYVEKDIYRMCAFVRFQEQESDPIRPDHRTFGDWFGSMPWTIPTRCQSMLLRESSQMVQRTPVSVDIPPHTTLAELRSAIEETMPNAVFGEGPEHAPVMLVGEQPGDEEDKQGRPFVGPAGRVLDAAIAESGLERRQLYLTNAVKTFLYVERGKRRIHKTPSSQDIAANRPWLTAEITLVRPKVIVCLGATAGQSVFGRAVRIGAERGKIQKHPLAGGVVLTYHPSAVLRAQEEQAKADIRQMLVADLSLARAASS